MTRSVAGLFGFNQQDDLTASGFELLSELVPRAGVIGLLVNPNSPATERVIQDVQKAARTKGLQLHVLKASSESEIDTAFASLVRLHAGALVVGADPFLTGRREQLVALASRRAVPSIYAWREFAASGGLISYGGSLTSAFRLVGRLRGKGPQGRQARRSAGPAASDLRAGRQSQDRQALGLTVPRQLLARATTVIE